MELRRGWQPDSSKSTALGSHAEVSIPALKSWVTLGKCFNLSGLQFLLLWIETVKSLSLSKSFDDVTEWIFIKRLEQCLAHGECCITLSWINKHSCKRQQPAGTRRWRSLQRRLTCIRLPQFPLGQTHLTLGSLLEGTDMCLPPGVPFTKGRDTQCSFKQHFSIYLEPRTSFHILAQCGLVCDPPEQDWHPAHATDNSPSGLSHPDRSTPEPVETSPLTCTWILQ